MVDMQNVLGVKMAPRQKKKIPYFLLITTQMKAVMRRLLKLYGFIKLLSFCCLGLEVFGAVWFREIAWKFSLV